MPVVKLQALPPKVGLSWPGRVASWSAEDRTGTEVKKKLVV